MAAPRDFTKIFGGFAVVTSLIGTIVGGANNISTLQASGLYVWAAGFGCSIAAVIIQAIALGLEFVPVPAAAAAPPLKSEPTAAGSV